MAEDLKIKTVPVIEQPQDRFYKMSIRFRGDIGDRTLDEMLGRCFPDKTISMKDAAVIHLDQIVTFIPDDEALKKYAAALEAGYSTGDKIVRNVRFDGYEYLYMVEPAGLETACSHRSENGTCRISGGDVKCCHQAEDGKCGVATRPYGRHEKESEG